MADQYDVFNYGNWSTIQTEELNTVVQPSTTYRVVDNRIIGIVDGLDAVRQAVDKILRTVRYRFVIYSENYGSELESLIGKEMDFVKADVERTITDALLADDRIDEIQQFVIAEIKGNSMTVRFNVRTLDNLFPVEQEVRV